MYSFDSQIKYMGSFESSYSIDIIKNEPMFFNCSVDFAFKNGGPITQNFIRSIPDGWNNAVVDSRVHMLMPGWFPCIPGYHHDDVARGLDGQPDYDNLKYKSEHLLGLVNADVCPTEFAIGQCSMPKVEGIVYKNWHQEVVKLLESNQLQKIYAESGKVIYFDWETFHTGTSAIKNGWRWFIRLSRNTDRVNHITNEIRRQVQVYLEFPMEGW